jgi:hypothetical protein
MLFYTTDHLLHMSTMSYCPSIEINRFVLFFAAESDKLQVDFQKVEQLIYLSFLNK